MSLTNDSPEPRPKKPRKPKPMRPEFTEAQMAEHAAALHAWINGTRPTPPTFECAEFMQWAPKPETKPTE